MRKFINLVASVAIVLGLFKASNSNKIVRYKVGDIIFERVSDVLNPAIDTNQRILLSDVEDARFVPTLINGESSFITLAFPCSIFDSRFYRSSEIT